MNALYTASVVKSDITCQSRPPPPKHSIKLNNIYKGLKLMFVKEKKNERAYVENIK